MKKTVMAQVYKYFVYIRPGYIEYFYEDEYDKALALAEEYGVQVQEMDV